MKQAKIARRMERIVPFYVMGILARAKELEAQGRSIVHMEVGEPDFVSPQPVIEACKNALDAGHTGYTPATGIPELRLRIADHYQRQYGIKIDPHRVIITPGSSGALQLIMGVLVNPGQAVLMTDPGYPCNKNFVEFMSGSPAILPVGPETGYQLSAKQVEDAWTDNTCAVMVATPSNPTGTLIPRDELACIHEVARSRGGSLIVDEIYQGLVYGVENYTALGLGDDLFVINSFSKYYGMTGWRLGWLVAPEAYVESLDRLAQNIFLSCSAPAQHAALTAFEPDCQEILESRCQEFHERRDFLLPALRELGFKIPVVPDGAFYLYANCSKLTDDSFDFAYRLLEEEGVAITPGKDFGSNKPEQHVRFAYTTSIQNMQEAVQRIKRFIGE
jgi:aspartate/methionine/tyrosine aminotransferase